MSYRCPLGYLLLFVILVITHLGFESGIWVLIAPVPGHCILVSVNVVKSYQTFTILLQWHFFPEKCQVKEILLLMALCKSFASENIVI